MADAAREFVPLVTNPHLLTLLGNFWPRRLDFAGFPMRSQLVQTEPDVEVLVHTQTPADPARGEIVLIHGLEGSGEAGYIVSLAHAALRAGFTVHRFHMRTCGGTENRCQTLYHAGLTSDLISFLRQNEARQQKPGPVFVVGFSLGGNVAIKTAAEVGTELLAGACTVSAPLNLAAAARAIEHPMNRLYNDRFVRRMKERLTRTGRYDAAELARCGTVYQIDDRITAPGFGFGTADRYYETQSGIQFVPQIRIPVLMIAAQDDPLIPFGVYRDARIAANPCVNLVAPRHGGHLGFLARRWPRFWADALILRWIEERLQTTPC